MSVEVSQQNLLEERCRSVFVLMCTLRETVCKTLGNRLSIHQVWGSLTLIIGDQIPNLFLITLFHLKCLLLSSLSPSGTPNRQKVG